MFEQQQSQIWKCPHKNESENASKIAKIFIYWVTGDIAELCDVFFYFYRVKKEGSRARDKTDTFCSPPES